MKKEELNAENIDTYVEEILKGKDDCSDIPTELRRNLIKIDRDGAERWDAVYSSQPSCKNLRGNDYHTAMREKYIKTYKICLGLAKE
jgi:hypothetical protein